MKTYCIIPPFDSVKQYQLILTIVLVIINIVAIYGLWKSSEIVYYQITQLSDQKYKLAIPFAEHNFGPFGRILIHCNILVRIIINNTCFRACIFKFAPFSFITVYKNFHFWPDCELISMWCYDSLEMPEIDSKGTLSMFLSAQWQCLLFPDATIQLMHVRHSAPMFHLSLSLY